MVEPDPDLEEGGDLEPDLAGSHTALEGDTADDEASRQSTRLDVALAGEEVRHG